MKSVRVKFLGLSIDRVFQHLFNYTQQGHLPVCLSVCCLLLSVDEPRAEPLLLVGSGFVRAASSSPQRSSESEAETANKTTTIPSQPED